MRAFISGHLDLTKEEFDEHYVPQIDDLLNDKVPYFVIGDARGADTMAQKYIAEKGFANTVHVYHMFDSPRFCVEGAEIGGYGFISDERRDIAMTENSDYDIAWVRPGREKSGTQRNLNRRLNLPK